EAAGHAQPSLHLGRGRREGVVGGRGREHEQIERAGFDLGAVERLARRRLGEVRGALAGRRDVALADAGALLDPFVAGRHPLGQLGMGAAGAGQMAAAPAQPRPQGHPTAACGLGSRSTRKWLSSSLIFSMKPWTAMSTATPIAFAKPSASVPPWLFTAMPLR